MSNITFILIIWAQCGLSGLAYLSQLKAANSNAIAWVGTLIPVIGILVSVGLLVNYWLGTEKREQTD